MANITYPDKSSGDTVTASNMNEIKNAVNTKQELIQGSQSVPAVVQPSGTDANINMNLVGKGTGQALINGGVPLRSTDVASVATTGEYNDLLNPPNKRQVTFSNGSTSGSVTIPVITGALPLDSVLMMNATQVAEAKAIAYLFDKMFPDGVVGRINVELGQTYWQQGGGAQAPSQLDDSQWYLENPATDGDLILHITGLPASPSSDITTVKYELNNSGVWTTASSIGITSGALDSADEEHIISGLTNGVSVPVRVLATNATGDGAPSTSKSQTPTAPAAFTPNYVSNQTTGYIIFPNSAYLADTQVFTCAFQGKFPTQSGTVLKQFHTSSANYAVISYNPSNGNMYFQFKNASNVTIGSITVGVPINTNFTIAASFKWSAPTSILVAVNGVSVSAAADIASGYVVNTPLTENEVVDIHRTGGSSGRLAGGNESLLVTLGQLFYDSTTFHDPLSFVPGENWGITKSDGTESFYMGGTMTAAQWNSPDANNAGYMSGLTLNGTYVDV